MPLTERVAAEARRRHGVPWAEVGAAADADLGAGDEPAVPRAEENR
jgi:hypothetical protein